MQAQLAAASSLPSCFLMGIASVPEEVLQQVAPLLLVRLLHHLNSDSTALADDTPSGESSASQPIPQVTPSNNHLVSLAWQSLGLCLCLALPLLGWFFWRKAFDVGDLSDLSSQQATKDSRFFNRHAC